MRTIIIVLLVGFSMNAWSAKPGSGRRGERTSEVGPLKGEIFRNFNNRVSSILNFKVELRTPGRMTVAKANDFRRQARSLMENIQRESRKSSFEGKREDVVSILESMNMGFATRSNLVEFIEKNNQTSDSNMSGILLRAKELVAIIDNSFNILKARVNSEANNPVDGQKIAQVLTSFGRVNGEFTPDMVMEIVRRIESIIDNPKISLRKIAFCK